jgi:hypothetical protein
VSGKVIKNYFMKKYSQVRKQQFEFAAVLSALVAAIILVEIFVFNTPFVKILRTLCIDGLLFVFIGNAIGFFYKSFTNKYYYIMQYTIVVIIATVAIFGYYAKFDINHLLYYRAGGLYVGLDLCIVLSSYLFKTRFLNIIGTVEKYSDSDKKIVLKNSNILYRHYLARFGYSIYDANENLCEYFNLIFQLLFSDDFKNQIDELSINDARYVETGLMLVHNFLHEHHEFVHDDRKYFVEMKEENVDAHVVNYRWKILKDFEKFVLKWSIVPATEPYHPDQKIQLILSQGKISFLFYSIGNISIFL